MRLLCIALLALPCRGDDAAAAERATQFAVACNATDFHEIVKLPAAKYVHLMDFFKGIDATKHLGVPCILRRLLRRPANTRCARWYVGRYDERRRNMYTTAMFENEEKDIDGYAGIRDVHIGLDVGGPAGTPIYAPSEGVIRSFGYNSEAGDYGHVIVTEHTIGGVYVPAARDMRARVVRCYMLFGHLDAASVAYKRVGQRVKRGERLGVFGAEHENRGWAPHVHFQVSLVPPATHDMPGVVSAATRDRARLEYPDPRLVAGMLYG